VILLCAINHVIMKKSILACYLSFHAEKRVRPLNQNSPANIEPLERSDNHRNWNVLADTTFAESKHVD
jgi:hypothetical protein